MFVDFILFLLLIASLALLFDLRVYGVLPDRRALTSARMLLYAGAVVAGSTLVLEARPPSVLLVFLLIPVISACLWRLRMLVQARWATRLSPLLMALGLGVGLLVALHLSPGELGNISLIEDLLGPVDALPKPDSIDPDAYRIVRS